MSNLIQEITVRDVNHVKIGITFPRRAKQLVKKHKAIWLNEEHTEIVLLGTGGKELDISGFVDEIFKDTPQDSSLYEIKDEFMVSLNKKYEKMIAEGMDEAKASEKIISDAESMNRFIKERTKERSIVKDAYRQSASVVLGSSPIEIIKRSKRRTRELHVAFSALLWTTAVILYFGLSYLLGYRELTWKIYETSETWLVFVIAAIIECSVEIYFCKKELSVLNENIDLRQINPAMGGDLDLKDYQKRLTAKIRLMSSAVMWISLIFIYFVCGYVFDLWYFAWIVFVFGIFFELLMNFIKKLKRYS